MRKTWIFQLICNMFCPFIYSTPAELLELGINVAYLEDRFVEHRIQVSAAGLRASPPHNKPSNDRSRVWDPVER